MSFPMLALLSFFGPNRWDSDLLIWAVGQMTLVAVVTYVVILAAKRVSPGSRVIVSMFGLLGMTLLPAMTMMRSQGWSWGEWIPQSSVSTHLSDDAAVHAEHVSIGITDEPLSEDAPWWTATLAATSQWFEHIEPPEPSQLNEATTGRPLRWLTLLVIIGVALGASRFVIGLWLVGRLRKSAKPLDDPELETELDSIAEELGADRGIPVSVSDRIGTAATVGWLRPVLLLPADWKSWTPAERRAVVAHELAHVCRGDYLTTAVAQTAVAISFFHPLAHALASRMRLDQELAADALASNVLGGAQRYVEVLAGLALRQPSVRTPGPAQAFLPPRRMFVRRLEMLRTLSWRGRAWSRTFATLASISLVALTLLASGLRPLNAQDQGLGEVTAFTSPSTTKTRDLRQLIPPSIIEGAIEIDVRALLQSKPIEAMVRQYSEQLKNAPFPIESLSEALVLMPTPGERPPLPEPLALLRFTEPTTLPEGSLSENGRQIDPSTFVLGGTAELRNVLGVVPPDGVIASLLDRHADQPVRIAARTNWLRNMIAAEQPRMGEFVWAFSPLWENVETMSLGIVFGEDVQIGIKLDSEEPQRVNDTLAAAKTLAKNSLAKLAQQSANAQTRNPMEAMMVASSINQATQLLNSVSITAAEKQVEISAKLDSSVYFAATLLLPAVQSARTAARRTQSQNNLKQILLALHNYHDAHGHFPAAVIRDAKSGIERSWRVEILPYIEQMPLYQQYRKDEPWDSPANQQVLAQIPPVYAMPGSSGDTNTPYQTFASRDAGLSLTPDGKPPELRNITDGTSNTVLVVETRPMVPWSKPVDITDPMTAVTSELRPEENGFNAGFGDGSVRFISNSIARATWQALVTRSGGEVVAF